MKRLMLGNEAVARGLYEAGCRFVSSYPGTPSTEITEFAAKYPEVYAEWAPNEKVAVESAIGASIAGARAFAAMKHVGANVAADPIFTVAYSGVSGGLVIAVADDPGMHSSQNEQDSRHYAEAAKIPMLEPSDSTECRDYAKLAFELSEEYDTPIFLRLVTRIAHSQSIVELQDRADIPMKEYVKNPQKYVMAPANAKRRHPFVEDRLARMAQWAEDCALNRIEWGDRKIGIIASGACYQYAREVMGDRASYLKLGLVFPLPTELIKTFAAGVDKLYVIEELDDVLETHCRKLGIEVTGKSLFPLVDEFSQELVREKLLGELPDAIEFDAPVPVRPPVLCPGCPHRGFFYTAAKLKLTVLGDIGCYTLGSGAPLSAMDTTICMGASISSLHGFNKMKPETKNRTIAVIGDSTFAHSGITGLVNIVYNQSASTVVILDNSITGMTGHQQNPTTGQTLQGDPTYAINLEELCHAVGIKRVRVEDPYNLKAMETILKEELAVDEPSVIIARRPCALLKTVKHHPPRVVNRDACKACKVCFKIGCPAITWKDGKSHVDETLCVGCGLCAQVCPFGAIEEGKGA